MKTSLLVMSIPFLKDRSGYHQDKLGNTHPICRGSRYSKLTSVATKKCAQYSGSYSFSGDFKNLIFGLLFFSIAKLLDS